MGFAAGSDDISNPLVAHVESMLLFGAHGSFAHAKRDGAWISGTPGACENLGGQHGRFWVFTWNLKISKN